jgi:hypothetical protein
VIACFLQLASDRGFSSNQLLATLLEANATHESKQRLRLPRQCEYRQSCLLKIVFVEIPRRDRLQPASSVALPELVLRH